MADERLMRYASHIYLNPMNKKELYFNVGMGVRGSQIYPHYEQWMEPYVSEDTFNKWMSVLKEKLDESPYSMACYEFCSVLLCICTFGICFCPRKYIRKQFKDFNQSVVEHFAKAVEGSSMDVKVRLEEKGISSVQWLDSKNQALIYRSKSGPRNGGPPLGFNLILTLPAEVEEWPPVLVTQPGSNNPGYN